MDTSDFPQVVDIVTTSIKRLAPNCLKLTLFFFDKDLISYISKQRSGTMSKSTFSFDGIFVVSISATVPDLMHPAFLKVSELAGRKSETLKRKNIVFLAIPATMGGDPHITPKGEESIGVL